MPCSSACFWYSLNNFDLNCTRSPLVFTLHERASCLPKCLSEKYERPKGEEAGVEMPGERKAGSTQKIHSWTPSPNNHIPSPLRSHLTGDGPEDEEKDEDEDEDEEKEEEDDDISDEDIHVANFDERQSDIAPDGNEKVVSCASVRVKSTTNLFPTPFPDRNRRPLASAVMLRDVARS